MRGTVLEDLLCKLLCMGVQVESLSGIAEATGQEVALQHLGARFASAAGRSVSDDLSLTEPTLRGGSSPMFSSSPH